MKISAKILLIILVFLFSACNNKEDYGQATEEEKYQSFSNSSPHPIGAYITEADVQVRNIILMIGDGMSLMHMYSAWTANQGGLNLENCEYTGLMKTHCADRLITDSAAGGTAMATGTKTNKSYVGVDPDGNSLKTICEYANENGKTTGVISTCRLTDATPATFSVENIDRDKTAEIAEAYIYSGIDFILGGGRKYFEKHKDSINLLPRFADQGYQIASSMKELNGIRSGKVFAPVEENDMAKPDVRKDQLWRATKKALEVLNQNDEGFFLMVESSIIDDYGHFNDLELLMKEILDFDRTIGKVFEWAEQHPGTLVLVTADHETGGLTLIDGNLDEGSITANFSTKNHSGVMVPVYAFGPSAEIFSGIFDNTDLFHKMLDAFNF